ncbi:hypothetical protein [Burkholderia pseudomallei]|uniref:hypothetical protein n=1 Tax=Burkholderia pseudomallei TaxID=28450 RepID=UPI002AB3D59D|nr:hypothetical protein [Burkholderia pseudomallei]MDY7779533.1 hypothetical protein [Burkholderia pseudomallei]MDY7812354.1 hypothetical protein [Burkholderia pseudomallei]
MAVRARLSAPREERDQWPWHKAHWTSMSAELFGAGDRRMEAENYLAGGYGLRLAFSGLHDHVRPLGDMGNVWQPSRLKGIQVSERFGTPFLAATQVFDLRPVPRKFLSIHRTDNADGRFVSSGLILVTCSGSVGRATLAHSPLDGVLISHDLLRVEPKSKDYHGWLYAFLRSHHARSMMTAAQYGHIIKHLEVAHLSALPMPLPNDALLAEFNKKTRAILEKRDSAHEAFAMAEEKFEQCVGSAPSRKSKDIGFSVAASSALFSSRRRMEASVHSPQVSALRKQFEKRKLISETITEMGFDVWLPNRFRRIDATDGVELLDSSDLFEINPDISRRIADIDFGDKDQGRVKAGWLLLSRSGQAYGLNGSVAIANAFHEGKVVSDDVIRIAPVGRAAAHPGYLFVAMSHPTLGRPLVKAQIYGSSIPHLDVSDVRNLPIVRLGHEAEREIGDAALAGARLLAEADLLEVEMADVAGKLLDRLLDGDSSEFQRVA